MVDLSLIILNKDSYRMSLGNAQRLAFPISGQILYFFTTTVSMALQLIFKISL